MKKFNYIYLFKKKRKYNSLKKKNVLFPFLSMRSLSTNFFQKKNFESLRRFISRKVKKKLKYTIFKKTFKLKTFKKSQKSRMGKGKGKFNIWLWSIIKDQKLFEISYLRKKKLIWFFIRNLKKKLPIPIFITY